MGRFVEAGSIRAGAIVILGHPFDPPKVPVRSIERTPEGLLKIRCEGLHFLAADRHLIEIEDGVGEAAPEAAAAVAVESAAG